MPIALGESLNATIDKLLGSPTVTTIAKNPILTALVISFIIMLIILSVFRDVNTGDRSIVELTISSGFWSFISAICILLLHNRVFIKELESNTSSMKINSVFDSRPGEIDTIIPDVARQTTTAL